MLVFAIGAARAQELNLATLIQEALDRNPDVLAAQKRFEAMAQRPRAASALPDPMLGVGYNANGYPYPGAGLGTEPTSNIGFMVTQELPYPGKRDLRVKMASKDAQAEWQNYLAAQLATIAKLKQAYYKLQHSYAMLGRSRAQPADPDQDAAGSGVALLGGEGDAAGHLPHADADLNPGDEAAAGGPRPPVGRGGTEFDPEPCASERRSDAPPRRSCTKTCRRCPKFSRMRRATRR